MLGVLFGLDKIIAFGRSILIARQYKLTFELDAFNVANNLPDLLFALISGGALAMAFIPVLTEYLTTRGQRAAWDLFSRVANLAFLVTASLAVLVAIFADPIVRSQLGIAPGFNLVQQNLIADLMRLNLVATCIFSISGLVMAGLQANQHFLFPALAPIFYNVGQIIGVLVFSPSEPYQFGFISLPAFGLGVHGLVYGVILGASLHLAIQIPGLIKYKFRWNPAVDVRNTGVIEVFKVVGPRLLTMFFIQLMFIARDNFASRLGFIGAASSLTYGWMIMQVPETLIGTAIATAILPTLAEHAARKEWIAFKDIIEKALRVLVAITLPIAAIMAAGIKPLIDVAFNFGEGGTAMLTWTLRAYLLVLTGYAIQEVIARSFYARKEAMIPLYGVMIRIVLYLFFGLLGVNLFTTLGAPVIALAEGAIIFEAFILFIWLGRKLERKFFIRSALMRGLLAAILSGAITYFLALYLPGPGYLTAMVGMAIGAFVALPIIYSELRLLFQL
ncbi:MAG: murein biosynthesis integral membrane protein MurJ [Chloroflexota bacterium]